MVTIEGHEIRLAHPDRIPTTKGFIGKEQPLEHCFAAWGIDPEAPGAPKDLPRLHFRLQGPPGVGKNEIVYEIVRRTGRKDFYTIQGHEEMTPEDLSLLLVPDERAKAAPGGVSLVLRASKLATAIYTGGVFFFDEINRVPERALTPLASVLDDRQSLYSALAGLHVEARDEKARNSFRFCCAVNPAATAAGRGVLPDYIEERTLPVIEVGYPEGKELMAIVRTNLGLLSSDPVFKDFEKWYSGRAKSELSVRQALALVNYAKSRRRSVKELEHFILGKGSQPDKESD
jgi:MoxR-like ATPase